MEIFLILRLALNGLFQIPKTMSELYLLGRKEETVNCSMIRPKIFM